MCIVCGTNYRECIAQADVTIANNQQKIKVAIYMAGL